MAGTIKHSWNGTILTITSDSGTSSCDLKGTQGDMGIRGPQGIPGIQGEPGAPGAPGIQGEPGKDGAPGYTPVKGADYFDGYTPVKGVDYFDGYTPVKGVDYFDGIDGMDGKDYILTNADKTAIAEQVENAVFVETPKFVDNTSQMTDTSKVYVLASTGNMWAYKNVTVEQIVTEKIEGTTDNPYTDNARISHGDVATGEVGYVTTPLIDLSKYSVPFELHLEGLPYFPTAEEYGTRYATFDTAGNFLQSFKQNINALETHRKYMGAKEAYPANTTSIVLKYNPPVKDNNDKVLGSIRFSAKGTSSDSNIYIIYTTTVSGEQWFDTGIAYRPQLTEAEKTEIAEEAASLIDKQLLSLIGSGEVSV